MHILTKLKKELVIESSNSDQKIKEFISKEILKYINGGQQSFIRKLIFDTKRNWNEVLKNAIEEMPELKLKLKNYNLEANFEEEAGGPSEETFYKEWDDKQRKDYINEHPDSKYAQKDQPKSQVDVKKLKNQIEELEEEIQYYKDMGSGDDPDVEDMKNQIKQLQEQIKNSSGQKVGSDFNQLMSLKKKINQLKKGYDEQMNRGNRLSAIDINKNLKNVIEKYNNIYDSANLTEEQKDKLSSLTVKRKYF